MSEYHSSRGSSRLVSCEPPSNVKNLIEMNDLFCFVCLGWGRISSSSNALAPRLKQASAPVASHSECRRKNGGSVDESSMVCVGGKGSSVCNGDSGGPLSCLEGGRWVVRGAASWVTSRTCPGHTYSVYARVSSYVNWINGYVQSKSIGEKLIERS